MRVSVSRYCLSKFGITVPDFSVFSGTLVGVLDFPTLNDLREDFTFPRTAHVPSNVVIPLTCPNLHSAARQGSQLLASAITGSSNLWWLTTHLLEPVGTCVDFRQRTATANCSTTFTRYANAGTEPDNSTFTQLRPIQTGAYQAVGRSTRRKTLRLAGQTVYSEDSVTVYASRDSSTPSRRPTCNLSTCAT